MIELYMVPALKALALVVTGIAVGIINTAAGGGSMISLPLLIFLGLPANVANGTNRLAILAQCAVGSYTFYKKGIKDIRFGLLLAVPASIGAVIGSKIAVDIPENIFYRILAGVMLTVMLLIVLKKPKKSEDEEPKTSRGRLIATTIIFFFVGIYGGVIQVGVGFIIMAVLSLVAGFNLIKVNSIKLLVVAIYMVPSFIVFAYEGKVHWMFGICLAIGNSIGAWLGTNLAVKRGEKLIKIFLAGATLVLAGKLLYNSGLLG